MEGVFEKNEKFQNFIVSNKNKILKVNEEVVLYKEFQDSRVIHSILEEQKDDKNISDSSGTNSVSEDESEIGWNDFAKNTKFGILMGFIKEFDETLAEIKLKNILRFVLVKKHLHGKLLDSIPEYRILEKKKILIVYKIFKSFTEYESCDSSLKVNYDILKVNDVFVQTIILEILLLVILSIFSKQLAYKTLKLILKSEYKDNIEIQTNLSFQLKMIINIDILYLIGLYFELYLFLQDMKAEQNLFTDCVENHLENSKNYSNFNSVSFEKRKLSLVENNLKNKIKKNPNINIICSKLSPQLNNNLEIDEVFCRVNEIIKRNSESSKIFIKSDISSITTRKIFINSNIINFIEKDLKCFDKIMNITQHVQDFLIIKNYDRKIIQSSYYEYKIFLEIRNYLFENLNKFPETNKIFNGHSNKAYYEHRIQKLNYDYYLGDNKTKGSNLLYKEMIVKVKKRQDLRCKIKNEIFSKELKEESSLGVSNSTENISKVSPIIKSMKNFGKINFDKNSKDYNESGKSCIRGSIIKVVPLNFLANLLPHKLNQESYGSSPNLLSPCKQKNNLFNEIDSQEIKYDASQTKNTFLTESNYLGPEKIMFPSNNIKNIERENFNDGMFNKKSKIKINKKIFNTNKVDINDTNIPKCAQYYNSAIKIQELFKFRTRNQYLTPRSDRNHPGGIIYLKTEAESSTNSTSSLYITPLPNLTPKIIAKKTSFNNIGEYILKSK
jgi:hypothetical protein